MNPFKRTINNGFGDSKLSLPRTKLLLYLGRPNLEAADVPIGDDTEIGDDTIIRWMFLLPADADIRAATGWVSGVGNIFYDAAGDPVAALASEIAAWSSINQWNVLFHLVSADTETGRLAIYAVVTPVEILDRAMKVLRAPQPDLPSAFFNGNFRLATYTGGPTYVPDHLGVLRSPGANLPAVQGMRLDGVTYINTDESGNPILPSTPQRTVTYNTDWTVKAFAETFDKFDTSDPLKSPGWLCEPVRTNKCACRKSNPVDLSNVTKSGDAASVLSVVDDTAALTAAGLIGVCNTGKVYKLDNSSGATPAIARITGNPGNTNPHSYAAYIRGGSGTISLYGVGAPSIIAFTPSISYVRRIKENVIPPTTGAFEINANPGQIVYFILPQLEEGAFCTSPIAKLQDGTDPLTAITRAATVPSFPTAGKIPVNNFAIRMIVVPRAINATVSYMYSTYSDPNNYTAMYINLSVVLVRKRISGVNTDCTVSIAHAQNVPMQILQIKTSLGMQVAVRTYSGGAWSAWTNGTPNSSDTAKANAQIALTYQLGALNGSAQFTGNISLFDCVPIPSGINDPMAWAKTHWGVA